MAQPACVFVPRTVRSKRTVEVQSPAPAFYRAPQGGVEVAVSGQGAQLAVRLVERGVCTRSEVEIVEHRVSREAGFEMWGGGSGSGSEMLLFVWVVISPVTLLVSGVITGISVAGHDDEVTRERKPRVVGNEVCRRALAGTELSLVFPGGTEARAVTNRKGMARVSVPPSEPPGGTVLVSIGAGEPWAVCYGGYVAGAPGQGCVAAVSD